MTTSLDRLAGWVPIRLHWKERVPVVDWCWAGTRSFDEPFFDQSVETFLRLPFSLMFRRETPIDSLAPLNAVASRLEPSGFIFHMSRCGSTLVSQMLSALPGSVMISEAGLINSVLQARFRDHTITDDQRSEWLRGIVGALGWPRRGDESHLFVKFDAWHAIDIKVIHQAYPAVPWIFLYRNPIEVLVAQLRHRGAHTLPGVIDPGVFGMTLRESSEMEPEEYCARILARVCQAALDNHRNYPGLLVNYEQLPNAVWTHVAEFFGLGGLDREAFDPISNMDAKNPQVPYQPDSESKQRMATSAAKNAVERWLLPVYRQLESARLDAQPNQ